MPRPKSNKESERFRSLLHAHLQRRSHSSSAQTLPAGAHLDEDMLSAFVEGRIQTRTWEKDTFPQDIWKRTAKMGITNCVLPKELGGRGYSCGTYAEMCRLIARGDPALDLGRLEVGVDFLFDADELPRALQVGDAGAEAGVAHDGSSVA